VAAFRRRTKTREVVEDLITTKIMEEEVVAEWTQAISNLSYYYRYQRNKEPKLHSLKANKSVNDRNRKLKVCERISVDTSQFIENK